jgi:hypothetical protein
MATFAEIRHRIAQIRQELADVSEAIESIDRRPSSGREEPLPNVGIPEREALRQTFDELALRMGIDRLQPIGAEALQEMMRQEGIDPAECLGSRGIREMREE